MFKWLPIHIKQIKRVLVSAEQADIEATIFIVSYLYLVSVSSFLLVGFFIIVFSIYSLMQEK